MAFVSGLMGPYMRPIPINASMGMLLSLIIAFTLTPWLALKWLNTENHKNSSVFLKKISLYFYRIFSWLLHKEHKKRNLLLFFCSIFMLMFISLSLPLFHAVILKMLPFDNKSELQLIINSGLAHLTSFGGHFCSFTFY